MGVQGQKSQLISNTSILFPLAQDGSMDCFLPQVFISLPEGLRSFSQSAWNKWDNSLPRGRGMANMTSGGPLLDKTVCLQLHQQVSPGRTMVCLGKSGWPALALSHSFLCPASPPPLCMGASLLLTLCATSLMFQELSRAELGARALGAQRSSPVRIVKAVRRPSGDGG